MTEVFPDGEAGSTSTVKPGADPRTSSPAEAALALAYHIEETGVGSPFARADLLARIKATLEAEALASFERPRARLRVLEGEGEFTSDEVKRLTSLARDSRPSLNEEVLVKRAGALLLAGRHPWFLAARFREESLAREGWRKEFLRFLAHRFFLPVRSADELKRLEARRVLALTKGNMKRTAELLGIYRATLYRWLGLLGSKKSAK